MLITFQILFALYNFTFISSHSNQCIYISISDINDAPGKNYYSEMKIFFISLWSYDYYYYSLSLPLLVTCAWEEKVAIFVERDRHDTVCEVEGLLHSITMVNVNVDVQNTWVVSAHTRYTWWMSTSMYRTRRWNLRTHSTHGQCQCRCTEHRGGICSHMWHSTHSEYHYQSWCTEHKVGICTHMWHSTDGEYQCQCTKHEGWYLHTHVTQHTQ